MASVIKSIQQVSITIAVSSTSNTATLGTSVTAANAMLIYNGATTTVVSTTLYNEAMASITLTNGTTVTATRGLGTAGAVTVRATVVEFISDVNSIQYGTVAIANGTTSNTGTLGTTVGANAFVIWLGAITTNGANAFSASQSGITLTNTTTVTASVGASLPSGTVTVSYCVVDLDSTIIAAIQQRTFTTTTNAATVTDTVTSASTTASLIIWGGATIATTGGAIGGAVSHYVQMTGATSVAFTATSATATSRTFYYTVVTFQSAVLNGNVQRGTVVFSSSTTATGSLGVTVTPAVSFVNWGNFDGAGTTPATIMTNINLDSGGAQVNGAVNSSSSPTMGYEVIQFSASSTSNAVGATAGAATVAGIGRSLFSAVGAVAGHSSVAGIGRSLFSAIGAVTGHSTVAGHATGTAAATATAAGHATVIGHAASLFSAVGTVAGHSAVAGHSPTTVSAVGTVIASCIVQAQDSNGGGGGGAFDQWFISMLHTGFTMGRMH